MVSLGRRWSRVLPLVLALTLLTPLAHWLSKNDDDILVERHKAPEEPRFVFPEKVPTKANQHLPPNPFEGQKIGAILKMKVPPRVNHTKHWKQTEPPPVAPPGEVRKSMVMQFGDFPLKDHMIHVIGTKRPKPVYLTIGVPTVHRQLSGSQYLITTLRSLLDNMDSEEELPEVVILVFAADNDTRLRQDVVDKVTSTYSSEVEAGTIQVLTVDREAYPPLEGLKRNYNDPDERVQWRAKQVVDFAFMFHYARNLSEYYLQIEDDVMSSPHFVSIIRAFVASQAGHWVTLDFSTLGFIGKLLRASDLDEFSRFLLMFYDEQPVDYLYLLYMQLLVQHRQILHRPTLFQHFGEHSSLAGKESMRIYKDKFFALGRNAKLPTFSITVNTTKNPAAQILTSLEPYGNFAPETPYGENTGYFWGKMPKLNDIYLVILQKPQRLDSIFVQTGRDTQQNDYLRHGALEVSPPRGEGEAKPRADSVYVSLELQEAVEKRCGDFTEVAEFDKGIAYVEQLGSVVKEPTQCVRVRITENQEEWIIFNDIRIKVL